MSETCFKYKWYTGLIHDLKLHGYHICDYVNWKEYDRCAILRHDIDNDIEKAVRIAEIESENDVRSTFFVLLTSDYYNLYSLENITRIGKIISLGHEIGLHFDEVRYPDEKSAEGLIYRIKEEADILSAMIDRRVNVVSMHRPSKNILDDDLRIPNMINSYGDVFFKEFKYLSDSRKRWREPVDKIINSEDYERLHILTHPIWYNDNDISIHDVLLDFVNKGNLKRYECMKNNITCLDEIINIDEVL